jgi:molecular chaperone DnaJ
LADSHNTNTPESPDFFAFYNQLMAPKKGDDTHLFLTITPEEATAGLQKSISLEHLECCHACDTRGGPRKTCPRCQGKGTVPRWRRLVSSLQNKEGNTCPTCAGSGIVCAACGNSGRIIQTRRYTLTVPPGIHDGWSQCIPGAGEPGLRSDPPGDLYITVVIGGNTQHESPP